MDSKDKALMDLRKNVHDLKAIIPQKDAQIDSLRKQLSVFQDNSAGIDAVRNSLQSERELTKTLNEQLETVKKQNTFLINDNEMLREINFELQKRIKETEVPAVSPLNNPIDTI